MWKKIGRLHAPLLPPCHPYTPVPTLPSHAADTCPTPVEDNGHPEHFSVVRGSLVETADLSHNAISDLGPLKHHRRLTSLSLSYNKLTSLAAMPPLARLQVGSQGPWLVVHCGRLFIFSHYRLGMSVGESASSCSM
jgi:hypothetical protein